MPRATFSLSWGLPKIHRSNATISWKFNTLLTSSSMSTEPVGIISLKVYSLTWYVLWWNSSNEWLIFSLKATFVSDHRNLFNINKVLNQQKKTIPWARYPTDRLLVQYLAFQTTENPTVEHSVRALVNDMANRQSNFNELTRYVGQQIKTKFRWWKLAL
jgi:hypothetical protein